jgi:hypothetical protein
MVELLPTRVPAAAVVVVTVTRDLQRELLILVVAVVVAVTFSLLARLAVTGVRVW